MAMASERILKSRSMSSAASTSLRFHENFDVDHVSSSNESENLWDLFMLNLCFSEGSTFYKASKIDSFRTPLTRMTLTLMT